MNPGAPPVILIHGALRGRAGLLPTAAYLRGKGLRARPFAYETRRETLEQHGERLERFIDDWLGERTETLGFLTHSMGGLVARAYLARARVAEQSDRQRLVMLAPPNRGSQLAAQNRDRQAFRWLYGRATDELGRERVEQLPAPPESCGVLILAGGSGDGRGFNPRIEGDDDGVVSVEETAMDGVAPELVGGVHSFLQWRPAVLGRAIEFLRG